MCLCPIIDNPQALRNIIKESKAQPTHKGAADILQGDVAEHLDNISQKWHKISKEIYDDRMSRRSKN